LSNLPTLRPNSRSCANLDRGPRSASYSEQRLGSGCGVSAASITRRSLARSLSFCGVRTLQATSCVPAHAALVAVEKVRPSSVQAGPAIMSASIRFRPAAPTRRATMILLAHPDSRVHPRAAVWVPHRLSLRPIAIWRGRHIHRRRTIVTRGCNRSPNDRSGGETAYQSGCNISAARLGWNGGGTSQSQHNCGWQEQKSFHLVTRGPRIPGHHRSSNF
jgi:hypothetical protein